MAFRDVVKTIPGIQNCYQSGLQAMGRESDKLTVANPRRLEGSVFLDECLKNIYPQESRWDYMISYVSKVYFIEIHPATTNQIDCMLEKLAWLKRWLINDAPAIDKMKSNINTFCWLATSGVSILKSSSQAKRMSQYGLSFPAKHLRLGS